MTGYCETCGETVCVCGRNDYNTIEQENEKLKADAAMLRSILTMLGFQLQSSTSSDAWLKEQKARVLEDAADWFEASEY